MTRPLPLADRRRLPARNPHAAPSPFSPRHAPPDAARGLETLEPRLLFSAAGDLDVFLVDGSRFLYDAETETGQIVTSNGPAESLTGVDLIKISETVCQNASCTVTGLASNLQDAAMHDHSASPDSHDRITTHGMFHDTATGPSGETITSAYVVTAVADAPHQGHHGKQSEHLDLWDLVGYGDMTDVAIDDGAWNDPMVWDDGVVPVGGARVLIPDGINLTFNAIVTASLDAMRVDGTLRFATWRDTQLMIETLVISPSGSLFVGTESNPVQDDVTARVIITGDGAIDPTEDPHQLGRGLLTHGTVAMHGRQVQSHGALAVLPQPGDLVLEFIAVDPSWRTGDTLALTPSDPTRTGDDVVTIDHIEGNTAHLTSAIQYAYQVPAPDLSIYAANLTRNVIIESANKSREADQIVERGHVMFMHNRDVTIKHARFDGLGRTNKLVPLNRVKLDPDGNVIDGTGLNQVARYSVHFHRNGLNASTPPSLVEGAVITNSPGWGLVNHSSHVDVSKSVSYDIDGAGFVTEVGHEVGSFRNNIAIRSRGSGQVPDRRQLIVEQFDEGIRIDDFGHSGHGFWLQGNAVEIEGNIAAGHRHAAFAFWSRGLVIGEHDLAAVHPLYHDGSTVSDHVKSFRSVPDFPVSNLEPSQISLAWRYSDDREVLLDDDGAPLLNSLVQSENVRLRLFKDNVAFASAVGVDLSRQMILRKLISAPYNAEEAGIIDGFTAWGIGDFINEFDHVRNDGQGGKRAIALRYVKHMIVRDARLIGDPYATDDIAIFRNNAVEDLMIESPELVDWNEDLGFSNNAGTSPKAEDGSYVTNTVTPVFVMLSAYDQDDDPLRYRIVEDPAHGRVEHFDRTMGTFVYVPETTTAVIDTIRFQASDGTRWSNPGRIGVRVRSFVGESLTLNRSADATYTTADGVIVTVSMSGPGRGTVHVPTVMTNASIHLEGTNHNTELSIDVVNGTSATLESLTVGPYGLKGIDAPQIDLRGGILSQGRIAATSLGDVFGPASYVYIGGTVNSGASSFDFGHIQNLDIQSGTRIARFTADRWSDNDGRADRLKTTTLNTLSIAHGGLTGVQVDLAGRPGVLRTLQQATILGNVIRGGWNIAGQVGTIDLNGRVRHWQLDVDGGVHNLELGTVIEADVAATGGLTRVQADAWYHGNIAASAIGSLLIGVPATAATARFGVDLHLDEPDATSIRGRLTSALIHATVSGDWWVNGTIGALSAHGFAGAWSAAVRGRVSQLETLQGNLSGTITARSFGNIIVRGDLKKAAVHAGILMNNPAQTANMRTASYDTTAGRIDLLVVRGSVTESRVTAGYDPVDGIYGNRNDRFVVPRVSQITTLRIHGTLDGASTFAAGTLPEFVWIHGNRLQTSSLDRFFAS